MSPKFKQYAPIVISRITTSNWLFPIHNHNHFEIILIEKGIGFHTINGNKIYYKKGSVFLLSPDDYHFFTIHRESKFMFIKFTDHYFQKEIQTQTQSTLTEVIRSILYIPNTIPSQIILKKKERDLILKLGAQISIEKKSNRIFGEAIIIDCLSTILSLIASTIHYRYLIEQQESSKISQIIAFIKKNISHPSTLKSSNLALHFEMSENYIGLYFKKETGQSLKSYIVKYRINMVLYRLKNSRKSISEIANDLGFFDESHLSRIFKTKFGFSPKDYRNQ